MIITNEGYTYLERIIIRDLNKDRIISRSKYFFNWKMSSIEYVAWSIIRNKRHGMGFIPELPIGKYFVDFGDSEKKIAFECDSKMYHSNLLKDKNRQIEIENIGWKVFRFNTKQIYANIYEQIISNVDTHGNSVYVDGNEEQKAIDENAYRCMECFFNSTFFKSFYPEIYYDYSAFNPHYDAIE